MPDSFPENIVSSNAGVVARDRLGICWSVFTTLRLRLGVAHDPVVRWLYHPPSVPMCQGGADSHWIAKPRWQTGVRVLSSLEQRNKFDDYRIPGKTYANGTAKLQ